MINKGEEKGEKKKGLSDPPPPFSPRFFLGVGARTGGEAPVPAGGGGGGERQQCYRSKGRK